MPATLHLPTFLARAGERHVRTLPRVAEVVLVVLVAQAAALLGWKLVPAGAAGQWRVPPTAAQSTDAGRRGPDVDAIIAGHLFGERRIAADPALSAIADAPDTRLDLSLLGILAATAERGSRALIASSDGEEKPYAVGDDIVRSANLQAIFPDRVILSRAGKLETLRLDKDAPTRAPPPPSSARQTAPGDSVDAPTALMLAGIREQLLDDPSRASEYIRVQPASSGGQLRGYRIYPGRDRAAFNAVGLRPGDLVTQVNGIQLNDANTALQMLGQLSQSNNITVVVERGGQQQTVNVNFN